MAVNYKSALPIRLVLGCRRGAVFAWVTVGTFSALCARTEQSGVIPARILSRNALPNLGISIQGLDRGEWKKQSTSMSTNSSNRCYQTNRALRPAAWLDEFVHVHEWLYTSATHDNTIPLRPRSTQPLPPMARPGVKELNWQYSTRLNTKSTYMAPIKPAKKKSTFKRVWKGERIRLDVRRWSWTWLYQTAWKSRFPILSCQALVHRTGPRIATERVVRESAVAR